MTTVDLVNVSKSYGKTKVLSEIGLSVRSSEFCVFVGPSGCGKSTLLRAISGLDQRHDGSIHIDGVDVTGTPPADRNVAMVFQSLALYPHMTARRNMSFGLTMGGLARHKAEERVHHAAKLLEIEHLLDRYPSELSGGQRQRVAIGRALVRQPKVYLFDEPLSSLDAALREQMRAEISRLHRELGATMLFVTHDQNEAMSMATRVVVLDSGSIAQVGTPRDLYERPRNKFVATFIGSPRINIVDATIELTDQATGIISVAGQDTFKIRISRGELPAKISSIGIRSEYIKLGEPVDCQWRGKVVGTEYHGSDTIVSIDIGQPRPLLAKENGATRLKSGEAVGIFFDASQLLLFDNDVSIYIGDLI